LGIVDNSPAPWVAPEPLTDARVRYFHPPENLGFGRGHNLAFAEVGAASDYHVLVNPDVYFAPEVIDRLLHYMEQQPRVGLVMPKILFPDGRVQRLCKLLPTPGDLFIRRFLPFRGLFRQRMAEYELHHLGHDQEMRVPCLSGCFMFLRSAALREVQGFDERFFLYMEDVDLCRRIAQKYDTMYYPSVHVYHAYGKGSYRNPRLRNLHIRAALSYFSKWGWFNDPERDELNGMCQPVAVSSPADGSFMRRGSASFALSVSEHGSDESAEPL
jgi:hypothetical protein